MSTCPFVFRGHSLSISCISASKLTNIICHPSSVIFEECHILLVVFRHILKYPGLVQCSLCCLNNGNCSFVLKEHLFSLNVLYFAK